MKLCLNDKDDLQRQGTKSKISMIGEKEKWYPAYCGKMVCPVEIEGLWQVGMSDSGQSQAVDILQGVSVFSREST